MREISDSAAEGTGQETDPILRRSRVENAVVLAPALFALAIPAAALTTEGDRSAPPPSSIARSSSTASASPIALSSAAAAGMIVTANMDFAQHPEAMSQFMMDAPVPFTPGGRGLESSGRLDRGDFDAASDVIDDASHGRPEIETASAITLINRCRCAMEMGATGFEHGWRKGGQAGVGRGFDGRTPLKPSKDIRGFKPVASTLQ